MTKTQDNQTLVEISELDARRFERCCQALDNGCVAWIGEIDEKNRCLFKIGTRKRYARRIAWMIAKGPVPYGSRLVTICQRTDCVNPEHLVIVPLDVVWSGRKKEFVPFVPLEEREARYEASIAEANKRLKRRLRDKQTREEQQRAEDMPWTQGDYSSLLGDYPIPCVTVIKQR